VTVSKLAAARSMRGLRNYLRVYRRRWHLTQEELAFLFGYDAESIISRLEREERTITLAVATACHTIFGVEPRELFPALIGSVEEKLVQRMYELRERLLESKPSQKTLAKLQLLQEALGRVTAASEQQGV
jgi:transcriptional regulator with XRE-family HTH domain